MTACDGNQPTNANIVFLRLEFSIIAVKTRRPLTAAVATTKPIRAATVEAIPIVWWGGGTVQVRTNTRGWNAASLPRLQSKSNTLQTSAPVPHQRVEALHVEDGEKWVFEPLVGRPHPTTPPHSLISPPDTRWFYSFLASGVL